MCDTILAPPGSTAGRLMLFGKNSDRQRNEAQAVEYFPRGAHAPDAQLACTYITIPQVRRTHAVLLSRPFWIWGAEMGANEHGVVIGNEGLYSRVPAPEDKALTGMDLLRLGLERAVSAKEALDVITILLERHGQGGNCGHLVPAYYHNSFMIADASEAFVLETVGRDWLVERVGGVRAISNQYSIDTKAQSTSAGLPEVIRACGWSGDATPNYAEWIADPQRSHIGTARARYARSMSLLGADSGKLQVADIMRILRDHDPTGQPEHEWDPRTSLKYSLCIHAGAEDRNGQTTGSLASELRAKDSVHWITATAVPCISIFKPVLMDVPLPSHGPRPTDQFDPSTLWWRHEKLHRTAVMGNFPKFISAIRPERDALEASFHQRVHEVLNGGNAAERSQVIAACWKEAIETEERWLAHVSKEAAPAGDPYLAGWKKMNQLAGLDLS